MQTFKRPALREVQREDGGKEVVFSGYAIVFDEPSVLMYDGRTFREYVNREAISQEMIDGCDIVLTAYHDREKMVARWRQGAGSMKCTVDEVGVLCETTFDMRSATHSDVAVGVERGDFPGMSFSFWDTDYTYTDTRGEDGIVDRHITNFANIFEMTVAQYPAYPATTANCKREWEALTQGEEELLRRQQEEQEARHQLARLREIEAAQARRAQAVREQDLD